MVPKLTSADYGALGASVCTIARVPRPDLSMCHNALCHGVRPDLRIVSLIASATEIVCALGLRPNLVGRSHECDFPPDVKGLPVCTSPKFQTDGSSYEIDQRVRAVLQESLSVYRVDAALLDELGPTHIVTQSQCEVCAVSLKDVEQAACELIHSQPAIISLQPNSLADIWTDIERVGVSLNIRDKALDLIGTLQERIRAVAATKFSSMPKLAYVEWIDPLMAGGNWMPELIELAGGQNLFGVNGSHSPALSWSEFQQADPDVIVVAPCGFDIERTLGEMHWLAERDGWKDLRAVKNNKVFVADGNQYFNRPGPRVVESMEVLAEIMHPDVFHFGHQDIGWVPFIAKG